MARFPPRLHVLLAANACTAVVIRRGPSKSVCTVLWDRQTDEFSIGQWMRGRIYERRCDLSPDGRHLIYFATNGRWDSATKGTWTAISRAPYLKAVTLLAKGDCWNGGGLFTADHQYWLNESGPEHSLLQDSGEVRRDQISGKYLKYRGECTGIYYQRLMRDGWIEAGSERRRPQDDVQFFEKPLKGGWRLKKIAHAQIGAPPGKGCYWDEHELVHPESATVIDGKNWEWADSDRGRLVWAADGKLCTAYLRRHALHDEKVLHDFNAMTFQPVAAPY